MSNDSLSLLVSAMNISPSTDKLNNNTKMSIKDSLDYIFSSESDHELMSYIKSKKSELNNNITRINNNRSKKKNVKNDLKKSSKNDLMDDLSIRGNKVHMQKLNNNSPINYYVPESEIIFNNIIKSNLSINNHGNKLNISIDNTKLNKKSSTKSQTVKTKSQIIDSLESKKTRLFTSTKPSLNNKLNNEHINSLSTSSDNYWNNKKNQLDRKEVKLKKYDLSSLLNFPSNSDYIKSLEDSYLSLNIENDDTLINDQSSNSDLDIIHRNSNGEKQSNSYIINNKNVLNNNNNKNNNNHNHNNNNNNEKVAQLKLIIPKIVIDDSINNDYSDDDNDNKEDYDNVKYNEINNHKIYQNINKKLCDSCNNEKVSNPKETLNTNFDKITITNLEENIMNLNLLDQQKNLLKAKNNCNDSFSSILSINFNDYIKKKLKNSSNDDDIKITNYVKKVSSKSLKLY
ncbi:hypothetical protein BCR32DRAFT_242890 [Anaeromyces robustus]|uniref:VHS domain-containing protein n=1 Tax=Anaeromyces robustus TaxID=1754192 RepID=A0A1Y1XEG2_9FUNG|nr:hypothetical protein BCR32DRAFT_242890 [Anaeromyces robustus]|eukprot:ORX84097.1 hypothetical protein BCR32DRAFT_242890 [Anaeromyces robustus]